MPISNNTSWTDASFQYDVYPLEREGIALHLDCMRQAETGTKKNILLIHGETYSSHEFDIDYQDYSLVRRLAREGYAVWRLDIAGFGPSGQVENGFLPDSDYAAEDINVAVEKIIRETGEERIDILGWSWGTVTVGRFAAKHPEHIRKVVLYAPILTGTGYCEVKEPFHHNTWEHAAEDFQKTEEGLFDDTFADPVFIELWCSSCWHYDRDFSPNGGRRDLCVDRSVMLFDPEKIKRPTLLICGDHDPYVDNELVSGCLERLPAGSELVVFEGGSHMIFAEKPFYRDFQNRLLQFLAE